MDEGPSSPQPIPLSAPVDVSAIEVRRSDVEHYRRHRRDSTSTTGSVYDEVEMSQSEVFAGPTSESLASSTASSFRPLRRRSDATWSFYGPTIISGDLPSETDEVVLLADDEEQESSDELDLAAREYDSRTSLSLRRRSSSSIRSTSEDPLIQRRRSTERRRPTNQKVYIQSEDLAVVIAGFRTSKVGYCMYFVLSTVSCGLAWLLFRWFPRWRVRIVGKTASLGDCEWVVVENQWGELHILDVKQRQYGRSVTSVFGSKKIQTGGRHEGYDDYDDPVIEQLRYFDYRYIRFYFHPQRDLFKLNNGWKDPYWTSTRAAREGVDGDDKTSRLLVFGQNLIDVDEKTVGQLLADEAFHPFYIFQIASLILWTLDDYYYYAACIFVISACSIISTLIETKLTMKRLREISRFSCDVRVLRNGFWRYVTSTDLVPGDVYEVTDPGLTIFPCDSLLLTGDCIVNESMLTGESVPVSKSPCTNDTLYLLDLSSPQMISDVARHFLFAGTKIVRARRPQEGIEDEAVALALVVRTGFNTTKGSLVRSMLFPKPSSFSFYRDSFYYIGVMACIAAIGFLVSLVNFIHLGLAWHLVIVRALDLITIVVPPALPATLTIGTNFALSRLKNSNIFCISPQRVNVGGKLDLVCFDKTGTLTEDGLDVLGVHSVDQANKQFSELLSSADSLLSSKADFIPLARAVFCTMATCHSLNSIDGKLLGDPLDLKMFQFTNWIFDEGGHSERRSSIEHIDDVHHIDSGVSGGLAPSVVRPSPASEWSSLYPVDSCSGSSSVELGIFKSFEFVSQLRRTSVIVKRFRASGGDIFVKGAPECMREICIPESFPPDYNTLLEFYTHKGYRVIACATRHVPKLTWVKGQKMKREEAESGLHFAGFIIFENKLKSKTASAISELRHAGIRKVMCTGDNILTAISVGRECGLIDSGHFVFAPHFLEGNSRTPTATIRWECIDNRDLVLNDELLIPMPSAHADVDGPFGLNDLHQYSLALSGEMFRWIVEYASEEYLKRVLVRAQIFARMSPDEKHELVERLQGLEYCVAFCGDGANDCGALKAADVGISLSEAEASVAAPFTSRIFDISCVPLIIREGRAALVTSFSCFKFMSLYSAIQFSSVSILYSKASNLGDFQFLFIDLFLIFPSAVLMAWAGPSPALSQKRPTASLISLSVLIPLLGQITTAFFLQFFCYLLVRSQDWYISPVVGKDKPNIRNSANTALFLISCFQYIFAGYILSVGPPYRIPVRKNYPYVATIVVSLLVATLMLARPPQWLYRLMELTMVPISFKAVLAIFAVASFIVALCGERYIFPKVAKSMAPSKASKNRKEYKQIEERMRL